ncbi:MAG TPA: amino acid adenylation domain-containing protein, partial [Thermoanaerobaculia bacterium]|nr:amino acid adenylation domain-containing protein [Thermoanaerobaculia bacterium]
PLVPAAHGAARPISFAQKRLWFLDRLEPGSATYNIPGALRLRGALDVRSLGAALAEIVRRHEVLRATFRDGEVGPEQGIARPAAPGELALPVADLRALPAAERAREVARRTAEEAGRPFDLERGPVLRALLLACGEDEHVFLFTLHHIVSDGWSMGVFVRELSALYEAGVEGRPSPLPELPVQYADFAAWQERWLAGETLAAELAYWRERLAGAPPLLELPADRLRPAVQTYAGAGRSFRFGLALARGLRDLSRRSGATLFMSLLAAFKALLARYTASSEVSVGSPIAGRRLAETEGLIGFFINTLILRTDLGGDPAFPELLARVREVTLGAYAHQDLPFERLMGEIHPERSLAYAPLFQVMLVLQNAPMEAFRLTGLAVDPLDIPVTTAKFDLTLYFLEDGDDLAGLAEYNRDLFDGSTIERLLGHLRTLLAAVADPAAATARLSALPLLTAPERQQLLAEWNDTAVPRPGEALLHRRIEAQAAATPQAVAVEAAGETLTYAELNAAANRLARYLRRLGAGAGVPVAVAAERSRELVVGLLAILKAGGAYVPLDPSYPEERIAFMLGDAIASGAAPLLLTQAELSDRFPPGVRQVRLDADAALFAGEASGDLPGGAASDDPAYVIYTSGSTGQPKGAINTHRAICNRLLWMQEAYGLTTEDRVLQKTPVSFDVSVWELFWPLCTGARLVFARPEGHKDADYLVDLIASRGITTLHFVPSMLRAFLEAPGVERCQTLRRVIASGEALPRELAERFSARLGAELHNLYGPTEAAVDVTWHPCRPGEGGPLPIGRPIANLAIHLLDPGLAPVPIGVPGELYIAGAGLARGYLGRPALSAERFVPNPFAAAPGERLYRTGDLARHRADGQIEYLGRTDHQVKIRGFRVELGEIEAALARHPAVAESVVVARRDGGEPHLAAYVVPRGSEAAIAPYALREFLRERLPEPMVPAFFVELPALPLSPNGKVDRRSLPAPERRSRGPEAAGAPRNRTEEILAGIWREVLRLDTVGIGDSFFELGGDSILSLQVISRAARQGLRLTPRQLFEQPTLAGLAGVAARVGAPADFTAEAGPVTGPLPLTPIQRWFFARELPAPEHFNQALLLEAVGGLDSFRLDRALARLLVHHDALRLRFLRAPDGWRQVGAAPSVPVPFTRVDLSTLAEERQAPALEAAAARLQASLTLAAGPLFRAALFTPGAGRPDRLLLIAHHLTVDGVSWRILLEDLAAAYSGRELPPKTASFRRWAELLVEHARSGRARAQAEWWLAASVPPALPFDRDSGENDGVSTASVEVALEEGETRALLQEVPRAWRSQINDALLATLAQAFAEWTGERRLWLDLEGHGREEIIPGLDLSRTVGWFTSLFPVLLDLGGARGPGEALKVVKEQLRAVPDRGLPFGLSAYLGEGETAERLRALPRPGAVFNYLGQLDSAILGGPFRPAGESTGPSRSPRQPRSHLLEITASIQGGRLVLGWDYSANRRATVERLAAGHLEALRRLIACCREAPAGGATPSDFPLARLDQAALDRLLATVPTFAGGAGVADAEGRLADLFPASPMQQGMLFHSLDAPGSGVYVEQLSLALGPDLDREAFARAWQRVVDRHPALRTAFLWRELTRPLQAVYSGIRLPRQLLDWRRLPAAEQREALAAWLTADRRRGFDLARPPLLRATLIDLGEAGHRFVWTYHHALLDGWSLPILLGDLFALYREEATGAAADLPPARSFRDYVAWLEEQDLAAAQAYWRRTLAGFTSPTPLGLDRPAGRHPANAVLSAVTKADLPAATTEALRAFARGLGVTLNTVVQGAWALLLHRHSGEEEVLFGAVTGGRSAPLPGIESIVGLFINTLPARVRVDRRARLGAWLAEIQERQAEARQHEHSPLAQVQQWSEVGDGQPLFESILAFEN